MTRPDHKRSHLAGFTIMEIVVATTIFALVVTAMLSLFDYTLKINRRTEALRQATQSMRNFIEFVAKEVRNGKIDYGVSGGTAINTSYPIGPCTGPASFNNVPVPPAIGNSYSAQDNRLAIQTPEGQLECFFLAYGPGNTAGKAVGTHVGGGIFAVTPDNPKPVLAMQKSGGTPLEILTPPNVSVRQLAFLARPLCDPYTPNCVSYGGSYPKIHPFVTILAEFQLRLPTGETTTVNYQTTVSTNNYDIPGQ